MKITLTELGKSFITKIKMERDKQLENTTASAPTTPKLRLFQRATLALPTIHIGVKCPRIKISEEFKEKYDSTSTSRLLEETTPKAHNNAHKLRLLTSAKETPKYTKIKQKFLLNNIKTEEIMRNVKCKLQQKLFSFSDKEAEHRLNLQKDLEMPSILINTKNKKRKGLLKLIQEHKYGKIWKMGPRCNFLATPKYIKPKYDRTGYQEGLSN